MPRTDVALGYFERALLAIFASGETDARCVLFCACILPRDLVNQRAACMCTNLRIASRVVPVSLV